MQLDKVETIGIAFFHEKCKNIVFQYLFPGGSYQWASFVFVSFFYAHELGKNLSTIWFGTFFVRLQLFENFFFQKVT